MLTTSHERLLRYLADGRFHSGEKIAVDLELSRAAIWKQVQRLRKKGLEIDAVRGRGYRLAQPLEWLSRAAIEEAIDRPPGGDVPPLELHTCLESTNTHLMRNAYSLHSAHTCLAETQTAGKGRLGRSWISPFGCNVYLSMLWRFSSSSTAGGLSLAVGVAALRALEEVGLSELQLKWPNDILWRGRKLGGILIEGISEYQGGHLVVIGLGINLWLPRKAAASIDQPWVDARTILGASPGRNLTIGRIVTHLLALLHGYESKGLQPWLDQWRHLNCVLGRRVQVIQRDRSFEATAVDVDDEGMLIVRDQGGKQRVLVAGEVKLRVESQG